MKNKFYFLLKAYENKDFLLQQKAKILHNICITILLLIPISLIYSLLIIDNPYIGIWLPALIALVIMLFAFIILVKGHFVFASHLILITCLAATWATIIFENGKIVTRLDTIVYVLGLLTMTALIETRYRRTIILYSVINCIILTVFIFTFHHDTEFPITTRIEFWIDNLVAITFVCVTSYSLFNMNKRALDLANQEITERKHAEEITAKANAFLEMSLSSLPIGVMLLDKHLNFNYVNPTFLSWVDNSEQQFLGRSFVKTFYKFIPNNAKKNATLNIINRIIAGKKVVGAEIDFLGSGQKKRNMTFSTATIQDNTQNIIGWVAVLVDLTERKQLESSLRQSQKLEAIGTLAGGIAHDFNNILSSVIGFSELALEDASKDTLLYGNINQILIAGNRAKKLVHQILTFSRQQEAEVRPVRLSDVIKEALKLLRSSIPANIDIQAQLETDGDILADPTQIHQLIMNLCTNAWHAMESGSGILLITLEEKSFNTPAMIQDQSFEPGDYLKLSVKDNGLGIHPSMINFIFDPFFTTKGPGKGTGMGLAVVHGIVKRYGGKITVESQPNNGSEFDIYFPKLKNHYHSEPDNPKQASQGNESILLIDDEQSVIEVGKQLLERLGYKVTVSSNAIESLSIFKDNPDIYDLVITDMTMPNMNGDLLAKEMLKIRPDIPIVLCSGYNTKMTAEIAQHIGIKSFIMKPFQRSELSQTIRSILDKNQP